MDSQLLAMFGALAGVLIGGFINFFASKSVKQREWKLSLAKDQIALRQRLYGEFLAEAQRLLTISIYEQLSLPRDIHLLNNILAQITLLAPEELVVRARAVREHIFKHPSMSADPESPSFNVLRKAFLESAREDIKSQEQI